MLDIFTGNNDKYPFNKVLIPTYSGVNEWMDAFKRLDEYNAQQHQLAKDMKQQGLPSDQIYPFSRTNYYDNFIKLLDAMGITVLDTMRIALLLLQYRNDIVDQLGKRYLLISKYVLKKDATPSLKMKYDNMKGLGGLGVSTPVPPLPVLPDIQSEPSLQSLLGMEWGVLDEDDDNDESESKSRPMLARPFSAKKTVRTAPNESIGGKRKRTTKKRLRKRSTKRRHVTKRRRSTKRMSKKRRLH